MVCELEFKLKLQHCCFVLYVPNLKYPVVLKHHLIITIYQCINICGLAVLILLYLCSKWAPIKIMRHGRSISFTESLTLQFLCSVFPQWQSPLSWKGQLFYSVNLLSSCISFHRSILTVFLISKVIALFLIIKSFKLNWTSNKINFSFWPFFPEVGAHSSFACVSSEIYLRLWDLS